MSTRFISVFQPVGDAAGELCEVIPGLDHFMAVSILRSVENGLDGPFKSDDGYTVTYARHEGWTVTGP